MECLKKKNARELCGFRSYQILDVNLYHHNSYLMASCGCVGSYRFSPFQLQYINSEIKLILRDFAIFTGRQRHQCTEGPLDERTDV